MTRHRTAMSPAEQQQAVGDLAHQLNKPLIYSNSNGYRIVVTMCTDPNQLVKDSFGFA